MLRFLLLCPLFGCLFGCVQAPEFPVEPVITFEGLSKNEIFQFTNGPVDSLTIQFSFTDGDGDISSATGDSVNVFLTDSRLGIETPYTLPAIPPEGTGNGISGDIFVDILNTTGVCCIFNRRVCAEDPSFPRDTFSYAIRMTDRAGNVSNTIRTPVIDILCLGQ